MKAGAVSRKYLPFRVKSILNAMDAGQRLCKSLRLKGTGETEITFHFEPSGRRVGSKSAQAAIETGLLTPLGDGLFEEELSQTWRMG